MHASPLTLGVIVAAAISTCVTLLLTSDNDIVRDLSLLGYITGLLLGIALSTYYALSQELARVHGRLDRVESSTNRVAAVERDVLLAVRGNPKLN